MTKIIIIAGINTDVGKTFFSQLIINSIPEQYKIAYIKPIQTGSFTDIETIKHNTNHLNLSLFCFYSLNAPISPHMSANLDNITINLDYIYQEYTKIKESNEYDYIIIELAGGLNTPLIAQNNKLITNINLIKLFKQKLVLVTNSKLGDISNTITYLDCCRNNNLYISSLIYNPIGLLNSNKDSNDYFTDKILKDSINIYKTYSNINNYKFDILEISKDTLIEFDNLNKLL